MKSLLSDEFNHLEYISNPEEKNLRKGTKGPQHKIVQSQPE